MRCSWGLAETAAGGLCGGGRGFWAVVAAESALLSLSYDNSPVVYRNYF